MSKALAEQVRGKIRDIPDFPKPGIVFKDITPLLQDAETFGAVIDHFRDRYADRPVTRIVGIESRGFIFGAALAYAMGVGLTVVRKPGKLPHDRLGVDYELEYGTDRVEMHVDGLGEDDHVILIDDLLATGGTASATMQLIEQTGAHVDEVAFVIELGFLDGRRCFDGHDVHSIVTY